MSWRMALIAVSVLRSERTRWPIRSPAGNVGEGGARSGSAPVGSASGAASLSSLAESSSKRASTVFGAFFDRRDGALRAAGLRAGDFPGREALGAALADAFGAAFTDLDGLRS